MSCSTGQGVGGIFIAQRFRQSDLVVEQQSVLAASNQQVQGEPDSPQERPAGAQDSQLTGRQKAACVQIVQASGAQVPPGYPSDRLNVAQAAGDWP